MAFNGWRRTQQILTDKVYSKEFPLILIVKREGKKVLRLNGNVFIPYRISSKKILVAIAGSV